MLGQFENAKNSQDSQSIKKYSINLLWINRTLNEQLPYICPADSWAKFIEKTRKWKTANPEAEVIIWYDSNYVTKEALEATQKSLTEAIKEDPSYLIKLKDIREIEIVKNNQDSFSDYIPVYTRVDLIKLILCVKGIEAESNDAVIFADLKIGDLARDQGLPNKQYLFKPDIMKQLAEVGLLQNGDEVPENQFFQVINNPQTLLAVKIYINACLSRINTALNCKDSNRRDLALTDLCTMVFNQEEQLMDLIYAMIVENKIKVNEAFLGSSNENWVKYDPHTHGSLPFGNFYIREVQRCYLVKDFDVTNRNSLISLTRVVKDLQSPVEFMCGRSDLGHIIPQGGNHSESISNLTRRSPADGSTEYKYTKMNLVENKPSKKPFV